MMIRSGFVSNSSSSSFILKASKDGIIRTKEALVEHLKIHPTDRIIYIGRDLNEGWDVFELSNSMVKMILDHEDRFLENGAFRVAYVNPEEFHAVGFNSEEADDEEGDVIEDLEDESLKRILSKNYVLVDYRSIGQDLDDDNYHFMKNYLLSDEEWQAAEDAEWFEDGGLKRSFELILYSKEYDVKHIQEAIDSGKPLTFVRNEFVNKYYSFIPIRYCTPKNFDKDKLSPDVKIMTDFQLVKFDKEVSVEGPFKIRGLFGIASKARSIKEFYKNEQ